MRGYFGETYFGTSYFGASSDTPPPPPPPPPIEIIMSGGSGGWRRSLIDLRGYLRPRKRQKPVAVPVAVAEPIAQDMSWLDVLESEWLLGIVDDEDFVKLSRR